MIGLCIICGNAIKLSSRHTSNLKPFIAIVVGDIAPPIISCYPVTIFIWIDPASMPVAMGIVLINGSESFSAIVTNNHAGSKTNHFVFVIGGNVYFSKIIAIAAKYLDLLSINFFPILSAIVSSVNFAANYPKVLESIICNQPIIHSGGVKLARFNRSFNFFCIVFFRKFFVQ